MTLRVHGIGNCDACRKARRWMEDQGLEYEWVDLREHPPAAETVERWLDQAGVDRLVNRRSTTWRNLPANQRPAPDFDGWAAFLLDHPTLLKRPVFDDGARIRLGFDQDAREWLAAG